MSSEFDGQPWRQRRRRPARTNVPDRVFDGAAFAVAVVSLVMLFCGLGIGKRRSIALDASEVLVVICAAIIVLLLVVVCIGLIVQRGQLPFGPAGTVMLAASSIVSPIVIWVRNDGVLTPTTTLAILVNGLCLIVLSFAFVLTRRRIRHAKRGTPRATAADGARGRR
ncbi:hypothetical protein LQ938_10240 [Microbacterium sp. cx-55]|uniref:hypothetical protein n=1 Tax=unclassified Microbacterium TaxID=2609290 RepID=UPI001CBB4B07|nr:MULTISPECIES: hypothetical protein [unclassified Microbacterium]MBZ4485860.1 hypothetical protein [Microbacterium sp. cx-55]MCC4906820.1 hypothetical protein [Microbacterium sp. cx-59]UGB34263.1 hypothetical protein LQ938_10240 [Microbacterium sp. cx-55]